MKLNINAKELLALHNMLHDRFVTCGGVGGDQNDPQVADDIQLRQVYNRLRACLIGALANRQVDPIDEFMAREQAKIDRLRTQNDEVKKEVSDLVSLASEIVVPGDDDDCELPDYPRRGPRNRGGNKGPRKG